MEYNDIRALLEKYWACETTEAEEAQLRLFYAEHEDALPVDLMEAAPLFRYFHAEGEMPMPELFTDVPAPWEHPESAKIIRPFWHHWMKYAAVLLLAVGVGYSVTKFQHKHAGGNNPELAFRATFDDPKIAYQETQRALQLISKHLNKGKTEMEKLSYFSEAQEIVQGGHN